MWERAAATEHSESFPIATDALPALEPFHLLGASTENAPYSAAVTPVLWPLPRDCLQTALLQSLRRGFAFGQSSSHITDAVHKNKHWCEHEPGILITNAFPICFVH